MTLSGGFSVPTSKHMGLCRGHVGHVWWVWLDGYVRIHTSVHTFRGVNNRCEQYRCEP